MACGNQGQAIFADDLDRQVWLEALAEAGEKTGWRIHAYVMMGHHYHLLVETLEGNLVAGIKWLQGTYTQRYNWSQQPRRQVARQWFGIRPLWLQTRSRCRGLGLSF